MNKNVQSFLFQIIGSKSQITFGYLKTFCNTLDGKKKLLLKMVYVVISQKSMHFLTAVGHSLMVNIWCFCIHMPNIKSRSHFYAWQNPLFFSSACFITSVQEVMLSLNSVCFFVCLYVSKDTKITTVCFDLHYIFTVCWSWSKIELI